MARANSRSNASDVPCASDPETELERGEVSSSATLRIFPIAVYWTMMNPRGHRHANRFCSPREPQRADRRVRSGKGQRFARTPSTIGGRPPYLREAGARWSRRAIREARPVAIAAESA
jgi:hypothetical protein